MFQGTFKGVSRKFLRLLKGSFHVSHVNSDVSVTLLRTLESKAYFVKDSASMFSHYETPSAPFRIFEVSFTWVLRVSAQIQNKTFSEKVTQSIQ